MHGRIVCYHCATWTCHRYFLWGWRLCWGSSSASLLAAGTSATVFTTICCSRRTLRAGSQLIAYGLGTPRGTPKKRGPGIIRLHPPTRFPLYNPTITRFQRPWQTRCHPHQRFLLRSRPSSCRRWILHNSLSLAVAHDGRAALSYGAFRWFDSNLGDYRHSHARVAKLADALP